MNAPITITATLKAWSTSSHGSRRLLDAIREGEQQEAAEILVYSNSDMDKGSSPWTHVGDAEVTVRLCSRDEIVQNELRTLQVELDAARAEWLSKQREIMDRISKLQALTNEVEA
jgi:hypothetical protein